MKWQVEAQAPTYRNDQHSAPCKGHRMKAHDRGESERVNGSKMKTQSVYSCHMSAVLYPSLVSMGSHMLLDVTHRLRIPATGRARCFV